MTNTKKSNEGKFVAIPTGEIQRRIYTVTELNRAVKEFIESEFGYVWLTGEISNWRVPSSGHAYFTLKDELKSEINAVMFRQSLNSLPFTPENGLEVICFGLITIYEKQGIYQIIVEQMEPKGIGSLQLAYEQLKKKLEAEGLFDPEHKKPLPMLPKKIGVVTSPTGAAIRDIIKVITRRFADVHLILYPSRVQGEDAAKEIVAGIRFLDQYGVDVIIVARGGGSMEDLWPFNEEIVVRAIYEAKTPIISAVGHEIDYTLSDFAADVRAPTPSAAAEIVVREKTHLKEQIKQKKQFLIRYITQLISERKNRLLLASQHRNLHRIQSRIREYKLQIANVQNKLESYWEQKKSHLNHCIKYAKDALLHLSPVNRIKTFKEGYASIQKRLTQAVVTNIQEKRSIFTQLISMLQLLSPLQILSRGYSLVWLEPEHHLVKNAEQLRIGDSISIQFSQGSAYATINKTYIKPIEEDTLL